MSDYSHKVNASKAALKRVEASRPGKARTLKPQRVETIKGKPYRVQTLKGSTGRKAERFNGSYGTRGAYVPNHNGTMPNGRPTYGTSPRPSARDLVEELKLLSRSRRG